MNALANTYRVEVKYGKALTKTFEVSSHSVGTHNRVLTLVLASGRCANFSEWSSCIPITPEPDPSQDSHKAFAESLTVPPKTYSPGGYIPVTHSVEYGVHETVTVETDSGIFTTGYCTCGEVFTEKEKMIDHAIAFSK